MQCQQWTHSICQSFHCAKLNECKLMDLRWWWWDNSRGQSLNILFQRTTKKKTFYLVYKYIINIIESFSELFIYVRRMAMWHAARYILSVQKIFIWMTSALVMGRFLVNDLCHSAQTRRKNTAKLGIYISKLAYKRIGVSRMGKFERIIF